MEKFADIRNIFGHHPEQNKTPSFDVLKTLIFNENNNWTNNKTPKQLIEYGKQPPLGVAELHQQGFNGEGVTVAIIDQPLAVDHPEYKGKIVAYKNFCDGNDEDSKSVSSMHGPAVASLLVGTNVGVAPSAKVIYAAVPMWQNDAEYGIKALKWILQENEKLPADKKIKFVSISTSFGAKMLFKNYEKWNKLVKEVQSQDICIVECTQENNFVGPGFVDYKTKQFKYGFADRAHDKPFDKVHVPTSLRTTAESYDNVNFSYTYWGVGGLSWGRPFAAGVLCLGQQANPSLSAFELKDLLIQTAQENGHIISPQSFVQLAKQKSNIASV